jgi:serine/threonine protein kinase
LAVTIGSQLGSYEIMALLGKGGFGEVYRAKDKKLKREVAIKILPDEFSTNHDRATRFQREAEVLASLNHPNIAHVYGLEESANTRCIVMELVEGETLQQRLTRGAIPVEEALEIAKQIADALEAAHERGIIHRDLKPGNIMMTSDGKVKVLDFGLAKACEPEASNVNLSNSPTRMTGASMPGVILGTASYMSPEQAKGRSVDKRTDIFAFGCTLYEMLTGKRAFDGEDVTDIISAVVRSDPDWTLVPPEPISLGRLLRLCLAKDARNRRSSATDLRLDLAEVAKDLESRRDLAAAPPRSFWKPGLVLALVAVCAIAAIIVYAMSIGRSELQAVKFSFVPFEESSNSQVFANRNTLPRLSPDGRTIAFVTGGSVWLRPIDALEAHKLSTSAVGVTGVHWSPDGSYLIATSPPGLKRIKISDGSSQFLGEGFANATGITTNADGLNLLGNGDGRLYIVFATSPPVPIDLHDDAPGAFRSHPYFLPDGDHFLYDSRGQPSSIYLASLKSRSSKLILKNGVSPVYDPAGYLLFLRDGALLAQAFDVTKTSVGGEAVTVAEGFAGANEPFSISNNGALAYQRFVRPNTRPTWFDRNGKVLGTTGEAGVYFGVALSPDGSRVAVEHRPGIGVFDVARNLETKLTNGDSISPVWSPNGSEMLLSSRGVGIVQRTAAGQGDERVVFPSEREVLWPTDWSRDGKWIIFGLQAVTTRPDIWALPLSGDRKAFPVVQTPANEVEGQLSPDARWLAYVASESGDTQVYVQSFPKADFRTRISTSGGSMPRWRSDGKEIFYISKESRLIAVPIAAAETFHVGDPKVLFEIQLAEIAQPPTNGAEFVYSVSPDGQRFLVNSLADAQPQQPITVILNWHSLLKK